jgi:hypothetical protein
MSKLLSSEKNPQPLLVSGSSFFKISFLVFDSRVHFGNLTVLLFPEDGTNLLELKETVLTASN